MPPRYSRVVSVPADPTELVVAATSGDRRALARLITIVEEGREGVGSALTAAFRAATPAYRIGLTGAPGAGKSTITDRLIAESRRRDESVAVLAVDPTSPFSGGAVLGDRVRMQDHVLDDGVFIRSMASRGHLGGLSEAAPKALIALETAGFDRIFIETVGVGQDEVEVAGAADTVVVVVTPGWGDGIQAAKAGILEIGDVFVVNKADRPGLGETVADLRAMLALGTTPRWEPPIVEITATADVGTPELMAAIELHRGHLGEAGLAEGRRSRRRAELETALAAKFKERAVGVLQDAEAASLAASVEQGDVDPWSVAERIATR